MVTIGGSTGRKRAYEDFNQPIEEMTSARIHSSTWKNKGWRGNRDKIREIIDEDDDDDEEKEEEDHDEFEDMLHSNIFVTFCTSETEPDDNSSSRLDFSTSYRKSYLPKTYNQRNYVHKLRNMGQSILFALGPAGCGKTMFACFAAIEALREGIVDKIVITRPIVTADETLGHLPGTIEDKFEPWVVAIKESFKNCSSSSYVNELIRYNLHIPLKLQHFINMILTHLFGFSLLLSF